MRSGWPHIQEEDGSLASQRQAQYGPEDSWPNGYPALGHAEGDFRYPTHGMDPYAVDLPAPAAGRAGEHPYASFGGAQGAPHGSSGGGAPYGNGEYTASNIEAFGYGDPGYSDPRYDGPASQDAGIAGTQTVRGVVESAREGGYQRGGAELAYPAPSGPAPSGPVPPADNGALYQQPWDYDQPLRYDGEEPSYPLRDSYGQPAPAAYGNPGDYNGSDLSMPGIGGSGYDLSGIIGTGEFPGIGYDQPGYDRLSYDDPRYDSRYEAPGTRSETRESSTRFDIPAVEDEPRGRDGRRDTRFDMPAVDEAAPDAPMLSAPVADVMDAPMPDAQPASPRFGNSTRFDMPAVDDFSPAEVDHVWPAREDIPGYSADSFSVDSFVPDSFSADSFPADSFSAGTANQTRFDMPAVEDYRYGDQPGRAGRSVGADWSGEPSPANGAQTSVDGIRALAPETGFRPAGAGLVAPADEQPVSWADEISFDRFGELDELSGLDEQDVPAAFTRVPETTLRPAGLDAGSRGGRGRPGGRSGQAERAGGKRRGRSSDRRQWLALGAICVAAAGAITFVMMKTVFSGPGGPAHSVSTPESVAGFTREPSLEQQMKVGQLRDNIIANGGGKISDAVSAVYQQGSSAVGSNPQTYVFVGGKLADSDPQASLTNFEQTYKQGGSRVVSPGSLGGEAACATASVDGESVSMCVWFDNDTFGEFVSPTMTPAALATTMEQARPSLEHLA